jgi:electron transport complex protein RnfC
MRAHTNGTNVMSVVIENDHKNTLCEEVKSRTQDEVDALTKEELISIIREGGIVGMGGATFPTHVKLSGGIGKVDTIIVNAGECEPYITADDRLCREMPEKLLSGLRIIMQILGLNNAYIGIEDNKPEAIKALQGEIDPREGIYVEVLPAMYPQGAEKQLIQAVTGRQVPSGALPAAVGCAVFNAATCKAIHDAVYDGMPLIRRIVTVSGDNVIEPGNWMVPIGTTYNDLLEACGRIAIPYKILSGGPMMGITQFDASVTVTKGTNAVTMLGLQNKTTVRTPHCIRCGKCMDACPMRLMPLQMYRAQRSGNLAELKKYNLMDCIECGCCAYTCPAMIPLVQSFRAGKQMLRDAAAKEKK